MEESTQLGAGLFDEERTQHQKALRPAAHKLLLLLGAGLLAIGLSGGGRGARVLLLQDVAG